MSLRLPQSFGPFQLLHRVAVGATAELYAAVRTGEEGTTPESIVKLFPAMDPGQGPPVHYLNEVEIGGLLDHDTLVRQLDDGLEGAYPWIELEWVEGKSLRQLMRKLARGRRKLPSSLAVFVVREICRALDVLHRLEGADGSGLDLVHGDLSPGNILLGYDGTVKLGDFGDVRLSGDRPDLDMVRPKGQLRYMSPEMALGEPLTQASDLFSLGAVLHECLTGKPLFAGGTEAIVLTRVKGAEVDPPSLDNPDIPPSLDRLVMTTLAPYADDRPPSARALWLALTEFGGEDDTGDDRDLLSKVMRKLFQKERAVERGRLANALELLRHGVAPAAPAPAEPPPAAPPPFASFEGFGAPETPQPPARAPQAAPSAPSTPAPAPRPQAPPRAPVPMFEGFGAPPQAPKAPGPAMLPPPPPQAIPSPPPQAIPSPPPQAIPSPPPQAIPSPPPQAIPSPPSTPPVGRSPQPPGARPPAPPRRSRMSLALLSPFQSANLEAVVVPEIPRAITEPPTIVQRPSPPREAPRAEPQRGSGPAPPERPQAPPSFELRPAPNAAPPAAPAQATPAPKVVERLGKPAQADEDMATLPATGNAAALLIVDSDADAREHFGSGFRKAGYHVDLADSGVSAMDLVFQRNYDLVLMATRMPRPNGIQVLKGLRRTWSAPELPVILTATHSRSQDVLKALSLGANDLVSKGIEFNVLHARVRTQIMLKLTYEALQATEARYDALVDHSSDMVFHLTPDGRIAFISPASRALLGYSPQSLMGRPLENILHGPDAQVLRRQAQPGEPLPESDDLNFRVVHRDRSLVWVRCQVRVTRDRRTGAASEIHGTCREQPPDSIGDELPQDEVAMRMSEGVQLTQVADALRRAGMGVVEGPGGPNDLRVVLPNGGRDR